jgi:hypothetical protein
LQRKAGAYPGGPVCTQYMTVVPNTLAYYDVRLITVVKTFNIIISEI